MNNIIERYYTCKICWYSIACFATHTGTHIDPPLHFLPRGRALTVGQVPLEILCGKTTLLDLRGYGALITREMLSDRSLENVERLLFRTASDSGQPATLSLEGAQFLCELPSLRLVGIDGLTIEAEGADGYPVHQLLLRRDPPIIILEGLDLSGVSPDDYYLFCLPLRLVDGDGGPARAVLVARDDSP